jgi:hypothetical protein
MGFWRGLVKGLKATGRVADKISEDPILKVVVPGMAEIDAAKDAIKGVTQKPNPEEMAGHILMATFRSEGGSPKVRAVALAVHRTLQEVYAGDPEFHS